MTAETIPKEMAKNVTEEVAETEIVTMKMAETEEVVKSVEIFRDFSGGTQPVLMCLSHQVLIIRISQQTSSWPNPISKLMPFRFWSFG